MCHNDNDFSKGFSKFYYKVILFVSYESFLVLLSWLTLSIYATGFWRDYSVGRGRRVICKTTYLMLFNIILNFYFDYKF